MTRIILSIVLALFAGHASAQTTFGPIQGRDCMPERLRTSDTATTPLIDVRQEGASISWSCSDGVEWRMRVFWCTWAACEGALREQLTAMQANPGAVTVDQLKAMREQYVKEHVPPWWVPIKRFEDQVPKTVPVWRVAKNSSYPDRPVRQLINGQLDTKDKGRIAISMPCDCMAATRVVGASRYCSVGNDAAGPLVAVCARVR